MGIGAGIVMLAAGAILSWAIDVDLPYVTDDALGLILMLAGIVAVGAAAFAKPQYQQSGAGTGVAFLVGGTIVIWAVDIDLPYVTDDALGIILVLTGTIALAASALSYAQRTQAGVGTGVALLAAGAILAWAVDIDLPYVADYTLGAILLVSGLIAIAVSGIAHLKQRRARADYSAGYGQTYRY
ncbi:MAG: hypothetical protein ACRDPQ_08505 [Nocardioidaceae bacterium]